MGTGELLGENCREVTSDGLASRPVRVEIRLAASCYRNRDKLRQLRASRFQGITFFSLKANIVIFSGEQVNYLLKPKAGANTVKLFICETLANTTF